MTPSLDDLLDSSAPSVTRRTAELARELDAVVSAAEGAARRWSPRRRRIVIASVATMGILGAGATAGATGLLPTPWFDDPSARTTQTTSTGATCDVAYGVKALEDPAHPVDEATRARTMAAAEAFLEGFDFSTIDVPDAVKRLRPRATADSERGPAVTAEDQETFAVQAELEHRLSRHLAEQGLPPRAVSLSASVSCTGGAR